MSLKGKDLISISDLTAFDLDKIFGLAAKLKKSKAGGKLLAGKTLGLVFQKPSTRTRVSFEVGMYQLGGYSIYLGPEEVGLGKREATKDVARTLSRYLDCIVARTFLHDDIIELARYADIPVINGLSDLLHPCQALSDLFTINERFGKLKGLTLAYIGDGNNVLHSLMHGGALVGLNIKAATPKGYKPKKFIYLEAKHSAKKTGAKIELFDKPQAAVVGADIIYTDVWTSMGQEEEYKKRLHDFKGYQVNSKLSAAANKNYIFMHCLPAHRNEEVTDGVLDGRHSVVFEQAENRLHVQKAILLMLLKG